MGGDSKRIKESFDCPDGFKRILKGQVEDLKFIVNHLKTDVTCTLESNVKQLKMTVEREIGVLVYSLMEESLKEQVKLKEHLNALQKENSLLIENEGNIMDELARLTLENEKLSFSNEKVSKELGELEELLYNDNRNFIIKELRAELADYKSKLSKEQEQTEKLTEIVKSKEAEVTRLSQDLIIYSDSNKILLDGIEKKNDELSKEICSLKSELETVKLDYSKEKNEAEEKIKELMNMNCELMDLGESAKLKESELKRKSEEFEGEKEALKGEIEILKKTMTTQKIEFERSRDTLNRERRLASLKISDLQEQVEEYKNKTKYDDENDGRVTFVTSENSQSSVNSDNRSK